MKNKKLSGFDDVHYHPHWKDELLDQLQQAKQSPMHIMRKVIIVTTLFLVMIGSAVACSDPFQNWLSQHFSHEKEQASVEILPNIQDLGEVTYLNEERTFYTKMTMTQLQQAQEIDVYDAGGKVLNKVRKQYRHIQLPKEDGGKFTVKLTYVTVKDQIYPILPETADGEVIGEIITVKKLQSPQSLILEVQHEHMLNSYLINLKEHKAESIGDLSLFETTYEGTSSHRYAYGIKMNENKTKLLYRCNAVEGTWQKKKEQQRWVLYDVQSKKRVYLKKDVLNGGLLGNEFKMVGDDQILFAKTMTTKDDDVQSETFYPVTYDYQKNTVTEWKDYHCDVPFTSSLLWRLQEKQIAVLDVRTQKKSLLPLPENFAADMGELQLFDGFYIYKEFDSVRAIYVESQHRWINFDNEEISVAYAYPQNAHALLLDDCYLITFSQKTALVPGK